MSTYNETIKELSESIESILKQTYKNIEFIIVLDNPKNYEIKKLVEKYSNDDERIIIIENEINLGAPKSLNRGLEKSKGYYIVRNDADDISFPDRIEKQISFLENNKEYTVLASNKKNIDEYGNLLKDNYLVIEENKIKKMLEKHCIIVHSSVVMRTDELKNIGGYRDFESAQDYDLWLRFLSNGNKIKILSEPLIYYRYRTNSITFSNPFRQRAYSQYAKQLYIERVKFGVDSFSLENKEKFLKNIKYYDLDFRKNFNDGFYIYKKGAQCIKDKKFILGIYQIIKSLTMSKELTKMIYENFKIKIFE